MRGWNCQSHGLQAQFVRRTQPKVKQCQGPGVSAKTRVMPQKLHSSERAL
jgi:hypothetical protein